jgi:uncharacterized protein YndB with AHSA1/START domain
MDELIARADVTIDAPADRVWQALTDPELIRQYMAGATVTSDWREGSPITYAGEWKGTTFEDRGTILQIQPRRRLRTTHYSPASGMPDVPENYHVVTYDLQEQGPGTQLTVTQENNPDRAMVEESQKTWAMMLQGIKQVAEQGTPTGR